MKPRNHLGAEPTIAARDHLDLAMTWIAYLRAAEAQVQATLDLAVAKLRAGADKQATVKISGETLPLATYRERLEQAAIDYIREHQDDVLGDRQSYSMHGVEIGWRKSPESVRPLDDDADDADVVREIVEQLDLAPELARIASEFELAPWIRIEIKLDRSAILKAIKAGQITADDAAAVGLTVARDDPKWSVK